jgi:dTDP-4-dehydrorhamnose reductase
LWKRVPPVPDRPRVLVLGASGLLGSHLAERLPASFETIAIRGRTDFDAANPSSVEPLLDEARADVIVNATGAGPSADPEALAAVNERFPRALAAMADARGIRVVQISSDGVFSGQRGNYAEGDRPDPPDAYCRSKLAGEPAAPHLVLRASFFGCSARRTGLVDWLIAQGGRTVDGFTDYRFSGLSAPLLADLVGAAIAAGLSGVYNVGGDPVTNYELLVALAAHLRLDVVVRGVERGVMDRTLDSSRFFAAIRRPRPTVEQSVVTLERCGELSRR